MRIAALGVLSCLSLISVPIGATDEPATEPARILVEKVPGISPSLAPAAILIDGELATLYLNAQGRVTFRKGIQGKTLDDETKRPGGNKLRLHYDGARLYAFWWQKQSDGGKHLYVRVSEDGGKSFGPVIKLNTDTGILPTYDVATNGRGSIVVVYHDERKPRFQVYANASSDGGKNWLDQDIRLDSASWAGEDGKNPPFAVEPQVVFDGEVFVASWKESHADADGKFYLRALIRVSKDGGRTWEPEVEVHRSDRSVMSNDVLLSYRGQAFLFGFIKGEGLLAFQSSDGAQSWKTLGAAPGTDEVNAVSQTEVVGQGDNLLVAYTYEPAQQKTQVHLAVLSLDKGEWRQPLRLDQGDYTRAHSPALAVLDSGTVIAAWDDYRDIRPNVYLNWSVDGGQTWQEAARPIDDPGRYITEQSRLLTSGDKAWVLFDRYSGDDLKQRGLWYRSLVYEPEAQTLSGLPVVATPSLDEKKQRLKERVEQLWNLRVQGKSPETYGFFDPAFRSRTPREQFERQVGAIKYHSYELQDIQIWDNIAGVKLKLMFSVPETNVMGQPFKVEPKEEEQVSEWVWVHDNWYQVYKGFMSQRYLKY